MTIPTELTEALDEYARATFVAKTMSSFAAWHARYDAVKAADAARRRLVDMFVTRQQKGNGMTKHRTLSSN